MSRTTYSVLCLISVLLVGTGCNKNRDENNESSTQTALNAHNQTKPIVALVPLIDHTVHTLDWSLSEEFTSTIHYRLMNQDRLYLSDLEKIYGITKKLASSNHPFSNDLSWVKKAFSGNEFVVFMELTEHQEVPLKQKSSVQDSPAELNMGIRLRVVDLRGSEPKIVLQELVHDAYRIPKQFTSANFNQVPWGEGCYSISPMGLAHAKLSKEIASRIEDYVLLASDLQLEESADAPTKRSAQ